jgi:hypothetical protein
MDHVTTLIRNLRSKSDRHLQEAERLTVIANTLRDTAYDLENALEKDTAAKNKVSEGVI